MTLRPAIFMDRDGTLSHEVGYVNHLSRFRLYPWSVDAVRIVSATRGPTGVSVDWAVTWHCSSRRSELAGSHGAAVSERATVYAASGVSATDMEVRLNVSPFVMGLPELRAALNM